MIYDGTLNDHKKAYNSCTVYIVLFFIISISISSFLLIKHINGKYQTN